MALLSLLFTGLCRPRGQPRTSSRFLSYHALAPIASLNILPSPETLLLLMNVSSTRNAILPPTMHTSVNPCTPPKVQLGGPYRRALGTQAHLYLRPPVLCSTLALRAAASISRVKP